MTRRCARSTRSTRRRLDRAPAARRHRAFARRGATIETRRRVGRTRARLTALARIIASMDGRRPPRDRASRARVVGRPTASSRERDDAASRPRETRACRAASARDARVARGKRVRDGTARANDARGRGSASATSRDANFFLCARRVTRPRRRAGTVARRERECEWCDFELMCSIAIVRRARRCASPPRARL